MKLNKALLIMSLCFTPLVLNSCGQKTQAEITKEQIQQVYNLAKTNGYEGTYEEWLESIRGSDGKEIVDIVIKDQDNTKVIYTIKYNNNTENEIMIPLIKGEDGRSIISVEKTNSEGLIDTYTITYSDETTSEFVIVNGDEGIQGIQGVKGDDGHTPIVEIGETGNWVVDGKDTGFKAQGPQGEPGVSVLNIEKTSTDETGLIDTYTITYSDGNTSTFVITNGKNGEQGIQGLKGDDGHTPVVKIVDGYWTVDDANTNIKAQGPKGEPGKDGTNGKSAYEIYIEAHPEYTKTEAEWLDDLVNSRLANKQKHTITFNTNTNEVIESQHIEHGEKIVKPADPVKEGYTFKGWYYKGELWSFIGYVVTEDMILEGRWEIKQFTFTYNLDNGQEPVSKKYEWNTLIDLPTPQKEGLKFLKWVDDSGKDVILPHYLKEDLSVTAIYTYPINVNFDSNGGSIVNDITIYQDEICTELPVPTQDAAVFLGWFYDNGTMISEVKAPFIVNFGVRNITLKAMWRFTSGDYEYSTLSDGTISILGYKGHDKDIVIPNVIDNKIVTRVENFAFRGNTNLNSVVFGENIKSVGNNAFENCTNLKNINFNKTNSYGDKVLLGCRNLTDLTIRNNISLLTLYDYKEVNLPKRINLNIVYNELDTNTVMLTLLKNITVLQVYCTYLEGFTTINDNDFKNYTNLMSLKLPSSLKTIGIYAFSHCTNLKNVVLPEGFEILKDDCFEWCENLSNINFPISLRLIGAGSLWHTGLKEAIILNDDCEIGQGAFSSCEKLSNLKLPNNLTSLDSSTFNNCISLTKLDLPRSILSTGWDTFGDCTSVTELRFYGEYIGGISFIRNTSLRTVYLGKKLKGISKNAFFEIDSIQVVYFEGTQRDWNDLIIDEGNESIANAKIVFNANL